MSLEIALRHRQGDFTLEATLATDGRLVALFGRSGSGKTTLVKLIAGLMRPEAGRIAVDGHILVDTERRLFVPAHRRRIGMVFQDARLLPHLNVRQNLLYGRWFAPRGERKADFGEIVDMLGLGALLERRPRDLSGGEQSRVAIGRALLASPRLLLMDEPLASLDDARKREILPFIERLRDETGVPIVYVSHSVPEVVRLATSVVVLSAGRVAAVGPTAAVIGALDPAAATGPADLGTVVEGIVARRDDAFGLVDLATPLGAIVLPGIAEPQGGRVRFHIPARDVTLATERPDGLSALNILSGEVTALRSADAVSDDITVRCGDGEILARLTRRSVAALQLAPGTRVHAIVKAVALDRGAARP